MKRWIASLLRETFTYPVCRKCGRGGMATVTSLALAVAISFTVLSVKSKAQGTPGVAPLPAVDNNPYRARILQLEDQLLARDNELLHVRAEWASCRASLDSADLTAQAVELVRRCEAATGSKCTWDDSKRRVVKSDAPKEPAR